MLGCLFGVLTQTFEKNKVIAHSSLKTLLYLLAFLKMFTVKKNSVAKWEITDSKCSNYGL